MQFMVYLTSREGEPKAPPSPEGMIEMSRLMTETIESGMVVATGQLGKKSMRLRLSAGEVSLTDGPFIEGKELVPGFTIIRVDTKEEAIEWASKLRRCMGDGELRITQVITPSMD